MTTPGDHSRPSREEAKAATRQRLLAAAKDIFTTTGYQGATLDSIAAKAGFTKGAVYWHFQNKQSLFLALVAESISDNLTTLETLVDSNRDDPDRLRSILAKWVDGIDTRETLPIFGVELEIEARRDPSFRALHQSLVGKHEAAMARFLDHYFEALGEEPIMPTSELAATLVALFKGFALSHQNRPDMPVTSAKAVRCLIGLPLDS
jgi:AcrR family transcriptional regulator